MKKLLLLLAALAMLVSLTACTGFGGGADRARELLSELQEKTEEIGKEDEDEEEDETETVEGVLGETMETYFYDFSVDSVEFAPAYGDYAADDGNVLLLATVTITNTAGSEIPMADYEFQAQWGEDDDEEAYAVPITWDRENFEENEAGMVNPDEQFPTEFTLDEDETVTGLLVYEVPADYPEYSISAIDTFSDDTYGNLYFVYFDGE